MTQPVPATCRPPCSVLKVPRVVNVATDSLTGRLAREGAAGHAQRHQDGDADQEHGRQCVVAHCLPPLWYNHVHGSRADGHRGVDFRGCQEGRPRSRRLDGRPSRGLVRDDRARPQVPHRVHQRTQDGRPPKEPPEGYAKFVTYVGPSIAADFAAGKVAKLDRRERRWETVHRAASVAAIVAAIAGIAAFALNLWLVLR